MSKMNQIQDSIRTLEGGAFQKLMDTYLFKRFGFSNITPLGSHAGTNKTTKGTPDSYVKTDTGKYILIAYGSVSEAPFAKIEKDILGCLDKSKTGVNIEDVEQIICCHTSTNITPGQSKQLHSHFPNTLLIGLGELALDLWLKYPTIAKDHLSIELDTHQIFDINDFIDYSSRNPYSTPLDMPILCRENEISDLDVLLDTEPVVIITGKSGTGKTRLSLELAEKYGAEHNYSVKIIKPNNESIYEDLQINFTDTQNFIVVVDDADQLVQVSHLLTMCIVDKRTYDMKIIMTVRDYAKESLLKSIRNICKPAIFPLELLNDKNVEQVLINNLDIRNDAVIHQIQEIAKGNIRLAIMAGKCVKAGKFESINNAFDIFDYYFSGIIANMDRKEIIVATIIAFYDSIELREREKPIIFASKLGIEFAELVDNCRILHAKEVVSIFHDLAVKFEDQNLRDYLLYFVIFKNKWITPSFIILSAFPEYRKRVIYAFNTLIQLFNTPDNMQYIEFEVKKAWNEIKTQAEDTVFQFAEAFHAIIPDETLLIVKKAIDNLPEEHVDFDSFDFEKTSNNHNINSKIIKLLISFKYSNHFADALQLAFYNLEHNTSHPMDFYFMFGEELGFDDESYKYSFSQERILIQQILSYYKEHKTIEGAHCIIFCISNSLKFQFSAMKENRDNTVTFYQFGLLPCKDIYDIRSLCFETLALLFDQKHEQLVIKALLKYSSNLHFDTDKQILIQDILAFSSNFTNRLDFNSFTHCSVMQHFEAICQRYEITCPRLFHDYKKNRIFVLYLSIKKDRTLRYKDLETAERIRKQKIQELCNRTTDSEFGILWGMLTQNDIISQNDWEISSGIGLVFSSLIDMPERFISITKSYIQQGTPYMTYVSNRIIEGLIIILGFKKTLDFINSLEFDKKRIWLAQTYDSIPDNETYDGMAEFFIEKLVEQKEERDIYLLSLPTAIRINSKYPEFLLDYLGIMNKVCANCPWRMAEFLSRLDLRSETECTEFVNYFDENINVLETAYLNAMRGRHHFDYRGWLLLQIIRKDTSFLTSLIRSELDMDLRENNGTNLEIIWDQNDYIDLITIIMKTIKDYGNFSPWNSLSDHILSYEQNETERWHKKDEWIEDYINKNHADNDAIGFLFNTVCNLPDDRRKKAILHFCKCNSSFSDFRKISLLPRFTSWSGSEVPIIENKIKFLEELKNRLEGFEYIEHRTYLGECIYGYQQRKENVLLREFIEAR